MNDLDVLIANRFPEDLVESEAFAGFYDRFLDPVRGVAITLVEQLRDELHDEEERLTRSEQLSRDRWWLFGEQQPTKSAASARRKTWIGRTTGACSPPRGVSTSSHSGSPIGPTLTCCARLPG